MNSKTATEIDQTIGARIAALRKAMGLSQTDLALAVGVTFQQIQKYEKGTNRISAGRLQQISKYLDVSLSALFEDDAEWTARIEDFAFLHTPGAIALLKAFTAIEDEQLRREVLVIAWSAARMSTGSGADNA